jgi:formylglycine-generating enzyme required for sulfatase activity
MMRIAKEVSKGTGAWVQGAMAPSLMTVVFIFISCLVAAGAEPGPDASIPQSTQKDIKQVSPQKLFESFSGYLDGMHQARPDRRAKGLKKEQRREPRASLAHDTPPLAKIERDEALAMGHVERQEWELAVPPLERAIKLAQAAALTDRETRLARELQNAQNHLGQEQPGKSPTPCELVNSVGMRLIAIRPGTFVMGNSAAEARRVQNEWAAGDNLLRPEQPDHQVRISEPFALGKYPVTVAQFRQFVRETNYRTVAEKQGWGWVYDDDQKHWVKRSGASWNNPGTKIEEDFPVTLVCHADAEAFCDWLGKRESRRYFLPTESQWEYAARGGKARQQFPWGDEFPDGKKLNSADRNAPVPWADRTMNDGYARVSPVGSYEPNGFWLYDMAGNVWNLCSSYYDGKAYEVDKSGTLTDPAGPKSGKKKAVRGGNWAFGTGIARCAFRFGIDPDLCVDISGFRVATALAASEVPSEKPTDLDVLNREQVTRVLDKVKDLVASGHRLEARKLVDRFKDPDPKNGSAFDHPGLFVQNVLDTLIDVTKDNKMESFVNSLGMSMVRIPAGSFVMGSSENDIAWAMGTLAQGLPVSLENEFPFHKVRITRPFFLAATQVTVGQFRKFVEDTGYVTDAEADKGGQVLNTEDGRFQKKDGTSWKNPGWQVTDDQPVTMVSWDDAQAFVEWLSAKEKLPYKLPTEAQWEHACRGGSSMAHFPWGDSLPDGRRANFADNSSGLDWRDRNVDDGHKHIAPVASYDPNGYGLYDMAGNVLQWTRDFYGEDYYRYAPEIDPEGPGQGENRVSKGGDWSSPAVTLRCSFRGWAAPDLAFSNTGFRVAIELGTPVRPFYFAEDFLTKKWVPDSDQRSIAMAVAKEQERKDKSGSIATTRAEPAVTKPAPQPIKGVLILGFTQRSDAKKANMLKGDVIIEYHGERDLTTEKFLALTATTKRNKVRPVLVFVRDGYQYSARVAPGFLGVNVMDTIIEGPLKKREQEPVITPQDEKDKKAKHLDWS